MASDADSFWPEHLQKWLETSRRYLFAGQDRPFDTRHDAEVRVVTRVGRQTLRLLTQAAQSEQDPLQQLERLFYAQLSFIARHPDIPRPMLSWSLSSNDQHIHRRVQSIIRNYEATLARLIDRARRRGAVSAVIDSRAAASAFGTLIQGLVLRSRGDAGYLLREAANVFPVYLNGMREEVVSAGGPET